MIATFPPAFVADTGSLSAMDSYDEPFTRPFVALEGRAGQSASAILATMVLVGSYITAGTAQQRWLGTLNF